MGFFDSHCHLDMLARWDDEACDEEGVLLAAEEALERAMSAGVDWVLNPGVDWASLERVLEISRRFPQVLAAVGIHPHEADRWHSGTERLRVLARHPKVVAIGEIGLDYHYSLGTRSAQHQTFREQIRLARDLDLPILVHSRDAEADTLTLLQEEHHFKGVLHCFTGSLEFSQEAIALGFHVSFSGAVTFKKSTLLREVAKRVPLERLLIETDSPYLAPPPHRGKRNEPAFVVRIAESLAVLHGVSTEEIARATTTNARRLFRLTP